MQRASVALVVVALFGAAGLIAASGGAGAVPIEAGFAQMDVEPDDVSMEVAVESDGDAVWTVEYRIRLATDDDEQAFEELRTDVENDSEAYTSRFTERMASTADTAESSTGRNMTVSNATVTAERRELPQSYGVLTYRFEWTNFAAVDGETLRVGDAVDGLFLDESSSLTLSWPEEYRLGETTPDPNEVRDRSVVWTGPVDFSAGQPRITIAPAGPLDGLPIGGISAVLGLLVVAGGAVAYRRRRAGRDDGPSPIGDAEAGAAVAGGAGSEDESASTGAAAASDKPGAGASESDREQDARTDDESGEDASGPVGAPPVDDELLSNEEQVLRLIESEGGRMKQKRVAEELDWTAAKTSQVVTGLREEGDPDGFRLGRENVLSLPDYEATDSEEQTDETDPDDDA